MFNILMDFRKNTEFCCDACELYVVGHVLKTNISTESVYL